jgi:HSP20 family molecular chaperone IbpA
VNNEMTDSGDFDDIFGGSWGDDDFTRHFGNQRNLERAFRDYVKNLIESLKRGQLQGKSELIPIKKPGINGFIFHGVFGTPRALSGEEGVPELGSETRKNEEEFELPETEKGQLREPVVERFTNENEFIALVELPGVDEQDIKVIPREGLIEVDALDFKTIEIDLPADADKSRMKSTLRNGILEIRVPLADAKVDDEDIKFRVA